MKDIIDIIKRHALNGINSYALFGFYSLLAAPLLSQLATVEEVGYVLAVVGFIVLIVEFLALVFKLRMIRIRSELRRIDHKQQTGEDIIPHPQPTVIWGFFMRLVLRFMIWVGVGGALGLAFGGEEISQWWMSIPFVGIFMDVCGIGYIYVHSGFFRDHHLNPREQKQDDHEREAWNTIHIPRYLSAGYYWKELAADLVLQVYALVIFTAFWAFINHTGFEAIDDALSEGYMGVDAAWQVFPQLIAMLLMGLMPIRIAYWLEDSTMAFHWKERLGMWIVFVLAAVFTMSPTIIEYLSVFVLHEGSMKEQVISPYFNLFLSLVLLVMVMLVHIALSRTWGRKLEKQGY